jgi:hypothetical protein
VRKATLVSLLSRAASGLRFNDQVEGVEEDARVMVSIADAVEDRISCSHSSPDGGCGADVGRHGAMKPAGRVRGCESMGGG